MAKRFLSAFLALAMVLALLGGVPATAARAAEAVTLKVCTPLEDQETEDRWLVQMLRKFEQAHPELEITWVVEAASIGDIGPAIAADPQAGADVFLFPNDQIGTLLEAGALSRLTGDYLDQVKNGVAQTYVDSVSDAEGGVYGFPITCNTWFMYYNKSVFNEEDVKSMETMLEKGVVSFPLTNSWYIWSFYAAAGGQLFGARGADAGAGIDLGENALAVTEYLVNLVNHENFLVDQDGTGNEAFRDGTAGAFFSGSWDYNQMYEALGEDLGAVAIPTVNIGGEDKQLLAFAGSKAVGVNACSDHEALALELASLLASEEAQLLRWQQLNTTPALTSLRSNADIQNAMITAAEMDTMARTSTVQPTIAAMGGYWGPAATFGIGLADGTITMENAAEKTDELLASLNPTSIGGDADVGAGEDESDEPVRNEEGNICVASFEELKQVCSMTFEKWEKIVYVGEEPLVINESVTLPASTQFDLMSAPVQISGDVTLTITSGAKLNVNELIVDGELQFSGTMQVDTGLTVNGKLIPVFSETAGSAVLIGAPEVEGVENIEVSDDVDLTWNHTADDLAALKKVTEYAKAAAPAITHCVFVYNSIEVSESLFAPVNVMVNIGASDGIETILTIAEGCTLEIGRCFIIEDATSADDQLIVNGTLVCDDYVQFKGPATINGTMTCNGSMDVRAPVTVDGTLVCNKGLHVFDELTVSGTLDNSETIEISCGIYGYDGSITLSDDAVYRGEGDVIVKSETLEAPDTAVPWLDMSQYTVEELYNGWKLSCVAASEECTEHSFGDWAERKPADCVNGGEEYRECTVCGAVETRETEALGHSYTDGVCTVCGEKQLGENETERDEPESDELVPDEYGRIVLNSFEDLKKACGMTLDVNASLVYDEAEPLIISESITLPQGVNLNCTYPMEVSEGVTFTVPLNTHLYVSELAVNGTLENYGTVYITDSLTVSGTMEMKNRPALYLSSHEAGVWVSVEGAENINGLADSTFVSSCYLLGDADEETLNDALTHAAECDLPYVRHEISVMLPDVTIEGTLTIPENTTLELEPHAVGMTIASGGKLTVDGALMATGALTVDGSLENNNLIIIEHDSGDRVYDAILTLNEGAEYSGNGEIKVFSQILGSPDEALPGMDLSGFDIEAQGYGWLLTKKTACEHSFGDWTERKPADCVNGGEEYRECTVCGAVETRETEALGHSYTDGVCTVCGEKQLGENETERDELPTTVAQGTLSNITWHLDSEGCLTLSGKGDMPHCELESDVPWLDYAEQITSARIEKGITTVGIYSFYRCLNLESVSIPAGVTAIGSHAFEWCRSLKEVILPESLKTIGLSAFYNCDGMEKLELGGVETIANDAFNMCRSLTEVTFPATLKEMRNYSFASCDNLTTITFEGDAPAFLGSPFSGTGIFPNETVTAYYPGDNTTWTADAMTGLGGDIAWKAIGGETVEPEPETIGGNCGIGGGDNLTWTFDPDTGTLTISGSGEMMDVSSAIYAPWAGYADQITGLVIEEGAENVGAFMCANLTALNSVSLPASLRWIEEASFEMTTALTEITFPETLESIGYSAFHGAGLTKVTLPANTALSPNAFSGCTSLIKAVINTQGESMGAAYGFCGCTALTDVTFGEGVTLLANYMFAGCTALKTITVPGSVDTISGNAFENCTSLYEVTLEDGIRLIGGYAFAGCTALREIELPASVEVMEEGIFNRCEKLEKILFRGSAPEIDGSAFSTLKVEAWYLQDDETWNEDTMKYYGSTDITWVPYGHTCDYTAKTVAPTCTEIGYTVYTCACGDTYMEDYVDALGHAFADGECTRCGEADPDYEKPAGERYVTRLSGDNRFDTAFKVADQMKVNLGIEKFDAIIVASGTNFADALSGSYLAAVKNAPILLSFNNTYNDLAKNYIRANLKPGGTVYILGGPSAVPISMESGLSGFTVKRLAGTDRFGTNLAILEEAGVGDKPVLVCTGLSFADSLSASASKLPILLVWNKLLDTQKAFLDSLDGNQLYVIGGETAVSTAMQETLEAYGPVGRIGGGNRFETSVMIAEFFFDKPESAVLAYAWNYPDGLCGGALASTMDAPLILTMTKYETAAQKYVADQGIESGLVLGGTGLISEKSVELIFPEKPQEKPGTGYEDELPIG